MLTKLDIIDYEYALLCKCCDKKVIDPDKRKGQIYLKGKCPECGGNSEEERKKSKKERKAERRAAKKAKHDAKDLMH